MTITTPKTLDYEDAFKILNNAPKRVKIIDFRRSIDKSLKNDNYFVFGFRILSTKQTVGFYIRFPPEDSNGRLYVGFDHIAHPLLSFLFKVHNNVVYITEQDLRACVGREFLATTKFKNHVSKAYKDLNPDYKYVIVPLED